VADVEAVIHAAGGGHVLDVASLHADNTETTRTILQAITEVAPQLKRFVLVSSLAAHGPSPGGTPRDPDSPCTPITHYGRAKAAAEAVTLAAADRFPVTIVRPPSVYGPRDWRMVPLYRSAARGWVPLPAPSRSASMIHVRDCVSALSLAVTTQHAGGRIYFVEDGTPQATDDMARCIGRAVGRERIRILRVPSLVLRVVGALSEGIGRLRRKPVLLHRDKVRDLLQPHWVCDASALRDELGWKPVVSFEDGVLETAADYRAEGLIP
jgi:nucleoside-diphosphate-sugar epimerase